MLTELLTEEEISRKLRLSRDTVRRMRYAGQIPWIQIGRSVRYSPSAVETWLQTRTTSSKSLRSDQLADIIASVTSTLKGGEA
jgi:excisionase family DNA binding protein